MFYKCNYCDPVTKRGHKPVKSINSETDEFVKDEKNKYYHVHCYKKHLSERKKLNEDEIELKVQERLSLQKEEIKEANEKDKLLQWIMEFYDGSLPTFFLKKLSEVRKGTYEGIPEPIDYLTILDIYEHMANYLNKIAIKKQFAHTAQRMNYDLAVVIGNYGDYKKYKEKQKRNQVDKTEVEKHTSVTNKVQKIDTENIKPKEFDITDVMDELLL